MKRPFRGRRGPFAGGGALLREAGPYAQYASSLEDGAEPALAQHRKASVYHQGQGPRQAVSSQGRGTDKENHPLPNHLIFFCLSTFYSGVVEEGAESWQAGAFVGGNSIVRFFEGDIHEATGPVWPCFHLKTSKLAQTLETQRGELTESSL